MRDTLPLTLCWAIVFGAFLDSIVAQSTSSTSSAPSSSATVFPGTATYEYVGCHNETTLIPNAGGARALGGAKDTKMEGLDSMTVSQCLSICGDTLYAGLEYGRECWCSPFLNSLSAKLPDSDCDIPCKGESSEICGGQLKITLYKSKSGSSSSEGEESSSEGAGATLRPSNPLSTVTFLLAIYIISTVI